MISTARRLVTAAGAAALTAILLSPGALGQAAGPAVELVSVTTGGAAAGLSGLDGGASIQGGAIMPRNRFARDGRYVVFESSSFNLVCQAGNGSLRDLFMRDRQTGLNTMLTVAPGGAPANGSSFEPVITPDGRYLVFTSEATNLVPGDTNGFRDVFIRDLQSGAIERISVSTSGGQTNFHSHAAVVSADGRYVAFESLASNLVPGDANGREDIFVRDRLLGTTERVSLDHAGLEAVGASTAPAISADGRYVVFESGAHPLVPGDLNGIQDIYLRDRATGTTALASVSLFGGSPNLGSREPAMSADGRYIVYASTATDIVANDTSSGSLFAVYRLDRQTGVTTRVSVNGSGVPGDRDHRVPSVSDDGRYVAFESWSTNLAPGDTNDNWDIYRRDLLLGVTERVSPATSQVSSISGDGSLVYFQSAQRLVASDGNFTSDVYLYGPPADAVPPGISFSAAVYAALEGDGAAPVAVIRTGNVCASATVEVSTSDGSATETAE